MKKKLNAQKAFFNSRVLIALTLCLTGVLIALGGVSVSSSRPEPQTARQDRAHGPVAVLPVTTDKSGSEADSPAQKFIENLPASAILPKAVAPKSIPAFAGPSLPAAVSWTFVGPAPIPNGQTVTRVDPVSGRVSAIAVNPTNPNIVYAGAAQGGVYRSLDGGATWVQLMDTATGSPGLNGTPLAIGAITIDPTNSSTVLVGTGEGNLSADSFFGTGFYIITGADGASPVVNGPFNAEAGTGNDIFTGRSIVAIAVDPANHNNVFCSTSSGQGGIVATANSVVPARGLYRSTNLFSATPTWTRLQVTGTTSTNTISTSLVMEPGNANNIVVAYFGQSGTDPVGIYRSTDALAAIPTFTQTQALPRGIL